MADSLTVLPAPYVQLFFKEASCPWIKTMFPWCHTKDFFIVNFNLLETKKEDRKNNITMLIRIYEDGSSQYGLPQSSTPYTKVLNIFHTFIKMAQEYKISHKNIFSSLSNNPFRVLWHISRFSELCTFLLMNPNFFPMISFSSFVFSCIL